MNKKIFSRLALVLFVLMVLIASISAYAATNTVPRTYLMERSYPLSISDLAPAECDGIRHLLEDIIVCSGGFCSSNGNRNELILGTSGMDFINGGNGDDCIVGGGGFDILEGGRGNDVLVGGPDNDILNGNGGKKHTDTCVDDPFSTLYFDCEVIP